jgi:hypothetical protein
MKKDKKRGLFDPEDEEEKDGCRCRILGISCGEVNV